MVFVIAEINAVEGKLEELIREFHKLIPKVKAEKGCLEYKIARDIPTKIGLQSPIRKDAFTVIETWQDLDALMEHLAAPPLNDFLKTAREMLAGIKVQVLEPA
jgi:quinol monooxygenase YgiN